LSTVYQPVRDVLPGIGKENERSDNTPLSRVGVVINTNIDKEMLNTEPDTVKSFLKQVGDSIDFE